MSWLYLYLGAAFGFALHELALMAKVPPTITYSPTVEPSEAVKKAMLRGLYIGLMGVIFLLSLVWPLVVLRRLLRRLGK